DIGRAGASIDVQPDLIHVRPVSIDLTGELSIEHPDLMLQLSRYILDAQLLPNADLGIARPANINGHGLAGFRIDQIRQHNPSENLQARTVGFDPQARDK